MANIGMGFVAVIAVLGLLYMACTTGNSLWVFGGVSLVMAALGTLVFAKKDA